MPTPILTKQDETRLAALCNALVVAYGTGTLVILSLGAALWFDEVIRPNEQVFKDALDDAAKAAGLDNIDAVVVSSLAVDLGNGLVAVVRGDGSSAIVSADSIDRTLGYSEEGGEAAA